MNKVNLVRKNRLAKEVVLDDSIGSSGKRTFSSLINETLNILTVDKT